MIVNIVLGFLMLCQLSMLINLAKMYIFERRDKNIMKCQVVVFNLLVDLGLAEHKSNDPELTRLSLNIERLDRNIKRMDDMRILWLIKF